RDRAGSAAAPAARCKNLRRGSFIKPPSQSRGSDLHSLFIFAGRVTFPPLCGSSASGVVESAKEAGRGLAPTSARGGFTLGSAKAALISLLTISVGVFLGAPMPNQMLASYPGTNSSTGGTSGNASERVAAVTASARSLPVLTYSIDETVLANATCTCPPSKSVSDSASPRYRT